MSYGDNVVLSYYNDLGLISPMTLDQVPGLAGLMTAFQGAPWKNDDGTYNGVPWTWGFTGPHLQRLEGAGAEELERHP